MNNPVMLGFMVFLLLLIVALGVWYVTAEHFEDRERRIIKHYEAVAARNRQLEDERRELETEIEQLAQSLDRYSDKLEGEPAGLEVVL